LRSEFCAWDCFHATSSKRVYDRSQQGIIGRIAISRIKNGEHRFNTFPIREVSHPAPALKQDPIFKKLAGKAHMLDAMLAEEALHLP